jgi:glucoamylase
MARLLTSPQATGGPGIHPRWTRSAKDAICTAYSSVSRVWFTASAGVLNEVYFPTIDQPQIRDLQFLFTDGETFFHAERRDLISKTEYLSDCGLGVRIFSHSRDEQYSMVKEVLADPHQAAVLLNVTLEGDPAFLEKLHLYVLLAPHLAVGGWNNTGNVTRIVGHEFLTAHKNNNWVALGASAPFIKRSCGYVGTTDGFQDIRHNLKLTNEFATAVDGNIALTGEIDLRHGYSFTVGLGFGRTLHRAVTTLFQSLGTPFEEHRARFVEQWDRSARHMHPLEKWSCDGGLLYLRSRELLLAHEDKSYPGAMIASLCIPWGEAKSDEDLGGYHLVWTRDMVNSATGLIASGDTATAMRALIYLACSQRPDGGFPQNFWIDGEPYWNGIQLDEVAFPIMLAWRLHKNNALHDFDPYPMVRAAAAYLIMHGPATPQERWEENSGYSPSTLASNIAALICAAGFARIRGDEVTGRFLEEYADFLESHVEKWTATNEGTLIPGIKRHYVRINPVSAGDPNPDESLHGKSVIIANRPPNTRYEFPAAEIVDGGFLELVRYGIRRAGDALIEDSLRVIDDTIKADLPQGPCWRRYSHDGYGQRDDGGPFIGWGRGRPWPLLTGERGHYELAAGRDPVPYLRAMEQFANRTQLLPEQVWDGNDMPRALLYRGGQTGSATPLMWAHAEYLKLLRSTADGAVFDLVAEVFERYAGSSRKRRAMEAWKHNRQARTIEAGGLLRIQALEPFLLHWSPDGWSTVHDKQSTPTPLGIEYVDIDVPADAHAPIKFTFYYSARDKWEGRDFEVQIAPAVSA